MLREEIFKPDAPPASLDGLERAAAVRRADTRCLGA
jgi:hypothetical protein